MTLVSFNFRVICFAASFSFEGLQVKIMVPRTFRKPQQNAHANSSY